MMLSSKENVESGNGLIHLMSNVLVTRENHYLILPLIIYQVLFFNMFY